MTEMRLLSKLCIAFSEDTTTGSNISAKDELQCFDVAIGQMTRAELSALKCGVKNELVLVRVPMGYVPGRCGYVVRVTCMYVSYVLVFHCFGVHNSFSPWCVRWFECGGSAYDFIRHGETASVQTSLFRSSTIRGRH